MDWNSTLKIAAAVVTFLITLGGIAVAIAKFFASQNKTLTALRDEIKDLKTQASVLKQPLEITRPLARPDFYQQLLSVSTDARDALGANLHSIWEPVPRGDPTHLKIILSSDPEREKVEGREIPVTQGLVGWVFQQKEPSFKNPAEEDSHYSDLVDKAAGTQTGQGAILSVPLMSGQVCYGVIQFLKKKGGRFEESDVVIAKRLAPGITRLLVELEGSADADIPSVAYGDFRTATILFADITNYSAIAGKLRLNDTVGLLNEYYKRLLDVALEKGGRLEEYLGDGLYVSFPHEASSQAARLAVATAIEMNAKYSEVLKGWIAFHHPVSNANFHRVGIATGRLYTGLVGHPRERRTKLIGAPVDLAAHLCEDAKSFGGGIAICPRTRDLTRGEWPEFQRCILTHGEAWIVSVERLREQRGATGWTSRPPGVPL